MVINTVKRCLTNNVDKVNVKKRKVYFKREGNKKVNNIII